MGHQEKSTLDAETQALLVDAVHELRNVALPLQSLRIPIVPVTSSMSRKVSENSATRLFALADKLAARLRTAERGPKPDEPTREQPSTPSAASFSGRPDGVTLEQVNREPLCFLGMNVLRELNKYVMALPAITRDDFAATTRDMANAAVRMGLIDPFGLALLVHRHGADQDALLASLDALAESEKRTGEPGPAVAWGYLRQAVTWLRSNAPTDPGTKIHEFNERTRAKMLAVVERHAVRVPSAEKGQ